MADTPPKENEKQEPGWLHRIEVGMEGLSRGVIIGVPTGAATLVDWSAMAINKLHEVIGGEKLVKDYEPLADKVERGMTSLYDGVNELTGYQPPQLQDATDRAIYGVANFTGEVIVPGTALTKAGALPNVFKAASTGIKSFFTGNLTRGGAMLWSATPALATTGVLMAEYHTGGALSEAAIDAGVGAVKAAAESDIFSAETVDMAIEGVGYFSDVFSALNKSIQNQVVKAVMKDPDNPDAQDIKKGKTAAVAFILQPDNLVAIGVKTTARVAVADDLHKGNREEADKYLAREFIDDVLKVAKVRALGDNQVSEADLKAALPEAMKNGALSKAIPDRLENGLKLLWPDVFAQERALAAGRAESPSDPVTSLLGMAFDKAGRPERKGQEPEQESAWSFLSGLQNNPVIGTLMMIAQKIMAFFNHHIMPMFKSALGGNLLVQGGTDRLSRVMAHNGHAMPQGAKIAVVGHEEGPAQEEPQEMLLAGGAGPQYKPSLEVR